VENCTRSKSLYIEKLHVRLEYRKRDDTSFGNYIEGVNVLHKRSMLYGLR